MKDTKIEWADHTINFWWGCTKISPACANCYAETMAKRMGRKVFGQEVEWGAGKPRAERLEKARKEALAIQRGAEKFAAKHGRRPRVFVNSMSDWLDEAVPVEWLAHLLETLHLCPAVDFMLLTKRPENWAVQVLAACIHMAGYRDGQISSAGPTAAEMQGGDMAWEWGKDAKPPANVWIGVTVENQECAEARIPALLQIPATVRFLSCEPLLGPLDLRGMSYIQAVTGLKDYPFNLPAEHRTSVLVGIDWVIAGGESGSGARPSHPEWFYGLRDQCQAAGVPFFFKQWGEWAPCPIGDGPDLVTDAVFAKGPGHDGEVWRVGKAKAGRMLQGREWNEFPNVEGGDR